MKVKGKKRKRWPKHGSGLSNPTERRFREAARNLTFRQASRGPSGLTVEAVEKHGGAHLEEAVDQNFENLDAKSSKSWDAKTFRTWATNFTQCTNMTFSNIHRLWNSNSDFHKEILTQLAGLTEEIKESGGSCTDTEYFTKLLELFGQMSSKNLTRAESVRSGTTAGMSESKQLEVMATAASKLMSMVVKKVPVPTLRKYFSDVSKDLLEALARYANTESASLLACLLLTLACLLRVQSAATWNLPSTKNVFKCLLDFCLHKKPKVKKAAHRAVKVVLKGSLFLTEPNAPSHHPATTETANFCVATIGEKGGKIGAVEEADTLHALNLLQEVMITFSAKQLEKSCSTILRVMTVNNPKVVRSGLEALHGLFSQHPQSTVMTAEVHGQIINALYEKQPEENDNGTMPAWLSVMEQAHISLAKQDIQLCLGHLPRLLHIAVKCLSSHHKAIRLSAKDSINLLLRTCIGVESESLQKLARDRKSVAQQQLQKVVEALEMGLSYQYHQNWDLVFQVFTTAVEVIGKILPAVLRKCLSSMVDLRESVNFAFKADVDAVVSKAISAMGPRALLEAVPLKITGNEVNPDLSRSWMLPVLRESISDTEMAFFSDYFLDLAERFRTTAKATSESNPVLSKTFESLESQVWSLLKGFCTRPTDLSQSFPKMAQRIGLALRERPDLQASVMAALRSLVIFSKNNEENKSTMTRFAKNYIPILNNLFMDESNKHRPAVLETVKVYFSIADDMVRKQMFDGCFTKLQDKDITHFRKVAVFDLVIVMVSGADREYLDKLYQLAQQHIKDSDKSVQKKAYRILEEICSGRSEPCQEFVASKLQQLQTLLTDSDSLSSCAPSTLNPRLRCLVCICQRLAEPNKSFISTVSPQAVLCTKVLGERARATAYNLIIVLAEAMIRWNPEASEQEVLNQYVRMLSAGFAGSTEAIICTLLAFTRILFHYKERLLGQTVSDMVTLVCQLLKHKRKDVVRAAISFVKTIVGAFRKEVLSAYLQDLVVGLSSVRSEGDKMHCHVELKKVLKKLMKKFGCESVLKYAPQKMRSMLQKARKELKHEEKKKKKESKDGDSDEEEEETLKARPETVEDILDMVDEEEEEDIKIEKKLQKSLVRQAYIREGGDDIADLMDVSAAKKIMSSKPKQEDKEKKESADPGGFKLSADGRLIITEPKDDAGGKADSDEDALDDLFSMYEGGSEKKKRKRQRLENDIDDKEDEPAPKYKAGGKGIHRKLDPGAEYRSKKAPGDITKKGKPDPYAYVPLNFASLNKRKRAKMKGQFDSLVKGARKGVLKAVKGARKGVLKAKRPGKKAK